MTLSTAATTARARMTEPVFLKTTFTLPADWLLCAARLPGKSLHIACLLRLLAAFENPRRIPLSNSIAATIGIDRNAKYRALQWLEDAELIRVQRKMGQPPLVTILNVAEAPDDEN